ncbi:MAG TPA: RNA methyltransferase [Alphaproteobacteria bacterium]|nr:RNA methyltransferase [Alphaproteobacteria bacterium]
MAGTDKSRQIEFRPSPAVILCEPQLGENIGATARAMANFGLWDLRLVNPRDGWPNERAVAAASRADHVIERVRVFDTVEAAIADLSLVHATTARRRDMEKEVIGPEASAQRIVAHIAGGGGAGLLFGRERWGLYNEEVALADSIVTLPVEPAFASLNIAQAVLLMAYEWRRQSELGDGLPFGGGRGEVAPREDLLGLFEHLEGTLDRTGFFKTADKRPAMVTNLRAIFTRSALTAQEIRTLRGVISSIDRVHQRDKPNRKPKGGE